MRNSLQSRHEMGKKLDFKVYYPYRDYSRAMKILLVLARRYEISSNTIANLLAENRTNAYPHKRVTVSLSRLTNCSYVRQIQIEQKSQIQNNWSVTANGLLTCMLLANKKELREIIEFYSDRRFCRLIQILENSGKRDYVENLVELLKEANRNPLDMEKTAISWYFDIRNKIKNLNVKKDEFEDLYNIKKRIIEDDVTIPIFKAGRHNANKDLAMYFETWINGIFN